MATQMEAAMVLLLMATRAEVATVVATVEVQEAIRCLILEPALRRKNGVSCSHVDLNLLSLTLHQILQPCQSSKNLSTKKIP